MFLIVFFIIGVFCAANEWHESFFWTMVVINGILFLLDVGLEIKKQIRIAKEDYERNKRNGVIK